LSRDYRIRFDDQYDHLLDELRDKCEFSEISEIVLFAAALGLHHNSQDQRRKGTRDVRLSVFLGTPGGLELLYLIGMELDERSWPDPLSDDCQENQIELLEAYANGGLRILQSIFNQGRSLSLALTEMRVDQMNEMN